MYRSVGLAFLFAVSVAGCRESGSSSQKTTDGKQPGQSSPLQAIGILKAFGSEADNFVVLEIDGKTVRYARADQLTYYVDPETKNTASRQPSDWIGETIVVRLEKRGDQEVAVSLRPPTKDQLPPDPVGTEVSGKFVGWNAEKYPAGKVFLEVDGKKREYPAGDKMIWYGDLGYKVKRDQSHAFLNVSVTIVLVNQNGREEVVVIRASKK